MISRLQEDEKDIIAKRISEKEKLRMDAYRSRVSHPRPVPKPRANRPRIILSGFSVVK